MPLNHELRNVQCFGAKSTRAGLEGLHAACFIPLNPNAPQQTMAQRSLCSKTSLLRPQQRIHAQNVTKSQWWKLVCTRMRWMLQRHTWDEQTVTKTQWD